MRALRGVDDLVHGLGDPVLCQVAHERVDRHHVLGEIALAHAQVRVGKPEGDAVVVGGEERGGLDDLPEEQRRANAVRRREPLGPRKIANTLEKSLVRNARAKYGYVGHGRLDGAGWRRGHALEQLAVACEQLLLWRQRPDT